ncbi:hypothetical protein QUB70_26180 [Microcoleus sp. A003_D6]|uniref:hypothetical protein n=1 Tax=Microcoleus sp. A003_D6 TaxID=3055266 RepID=UPI002FCFCDCC
MLRLFAGYSNQSEPLLAVEVASTQSASLLKSIHERFDRQSDNRTDNPETRLSLLPDEKIYTILHNSHHVIEWLEAVDF